MFTKPLEYLQAYIADKMLEGWDSTITEPSGSTALSLLDTTTLVFSGPLHPKPSKEQEAALAQFLQLIGQGERERVKAMLEKNPHLALLSGTVKDDLGERTFNITGLQYALWTLNLDIAKLFSTYLTKEQTTEQLESIATSSWVKDHNLHAGMPGGPVDTLINAYEAFYKNYDTWCKKKQWQSIESHWCEKIGGAQRKLPAIFVHWFCSSLDPNAFLSQSHPRPTRDITWGDDGIPWNDGMFCGGCLGTSFAVVRNGGGARPQRALEWPCGLIAFETIPGLLLGDVLQDMENLKSLKALVIQERETLIQKLISDQPHTAPRQGM